MLSHPSLIPWTSHSSDMSSMVSTKPRRPHTGNCWFSEFYENYSSVSGSSTSCTLLPREISTNIAPLMNSDASRLPGCVIPNNYLKLASRLRETLDRNLALISRYHFFFFFLIRIGDITHLLDSDPGPQKSRNCLV